MKSVIAIVAAVVVLGLAAASQPLLGPFNQDGAGPVVIYAAPTLFRLTEEAAQQAKISTDIRSIGSVQAARLIESGKVPDVYLSVDIELSRLVNPLKLIELGGFELVLICEREHGLSDLKNVRLGIADPNLAPVGYRALVALYWLSEKDGYFSLDEVQADLGVSYSQLDDEINIDATHFRAQGRFLARDDLGGVATLLESGGVDCMFASTPFVIARGYQENFRVIPLPTEIDFSKDPPGRFTAQLQIGQVEVRRFEAFAASFSEAGSAFLEVLERMDASGYGLRRD